VRHTSNASGDDGDHFRDKLEAILAKHVKAASSLSGLRLDNV
jgi:hypothetical protein